MYVWGAVEVDSVPMYVCMLKHRYCEGIISMAKVASDHPRR